MKTMQYQRHFGTTCLIGAVFGFLFYLHILDTSTLPKTVNLKPQYLNKINDKTKLGTEQRHKYYNQSTTALHKKDNSNESNSNSSTCPKVLSLGDSNPQMPPLTRSVLRYLRMLKRHRGFFYRIEPYKLLADRMPMMADRGGEELPPISGRSNDTISAGSRSNDTISAGSRSNDTISAGSRSNDTISAGSRSNDTDSGHKRQNLTISKLWRLDQVDGHLPHLPCRMRQYSWQQLQQCVENRSGVGLNTRLLIIGDSRIRQLVEVFLEVFRGLQFAITTYEGQVLSTEEFLGSDADILWTKYKKRFVARSKVAPQLELEFYWTANFGVQNRGFMLSQPVQNPNATSIIHKLKEEEISEGKTNVTHLLLEEYEKTEKHKSKLYDNSTSSKVEKDGSEGNRTADTERNARVKQFKSDPVQRLKKLLKLPKHRVPAAVITGTGVWSLDNHIQVLRILDDVTLRQIYLLRPLLKQLRRITDVIWMMPQPMKDYMYTSKLPRGFYTNLYNDQMEWISSAQLQYLVPEHITVWDSFYPLAQASIMDCVTAIPDDSLLPSHPDLPLTESWKCGDRIHTNTEAFVVAVQMMANYLCNTHMDHDTNHDTGYCCSDQ